VSLIDEKPNHALIQVAGLGLELDGRDADLKILPPRCYEEFLKPVGQPQAFLLLTEDGESFPHYADRLVLKIKNQSLDSNEEIANIYPVFHYDNWEIKFDSQGNFILEALRIPPSRRLVINPEFSRGELQGDYSDSEIDGYYPLKDMDMKLFVNWLACSGDIILHASGVIVNGKGYAFAGIAGAGKSTLASFLLQNQAATILGEDQVILRYLDGRFWIFGTPWHENPGMCSPQGVLLEKLFFLDRDWRQGTSMIKPVEGTTRILQTAFVPFYRQDLLPGILARLDRLSSAVPYFVLSYQLGADPWPLIAGA
jgi:hypothetical protein